MAVKIFYSYAHQDEALREQIEKQLSLLKWQGIISAWHDRKLLAGQEWAGEIDKHLNTADIILLLVSPDFMASEYCYGVEMKRAMERHESGEALVIPVILRPVYWQGAPFGKLQALPTDARPVTSSSWHNLDEAFFNVAEGLRRIIETHLSRQIQTPFQVPSESTDPFRDYLQALYQDLVSYLDKTTFFVLPGQSHIIPLHAEATPGAVTTHKEAVIHALPMAFFDMAGIGEAEAVYDDFHRAFEKHAGRVLLLGQPGAGKTTTLMAFARDAVSKRLEDTSQPLPILAPIATWDAEKQTGLAEWLASITPKLKAEDISRTLEQGRALLLFDGLDELGGERTHDETKERYDPRQRFIQKISQNNQVVITCRVKDYEEVRTESALNGAVTLHSLDDTQIQEYLRDLPELWKVLRADDELHEMARTPFLLSLFTFAFAGLPEEAQKLYSLSRGELRDTIFETYLKRRYSHEANKLKARKSQVKLPFSLEQINDVLGKIAMADAGGGGSQNVFSLHNFVRVLGRNTAQQFVDFVCLLNILIWQNENLRFIHLRMRDYFAFRYAQTVLLSGDPQIRDSAAWALWEIPDERVVPLLIEALKDPYEYARGSAAGALGRIGDIRAIEPLSKLLSDRTPVASMYGTHICEVAATALKMIGTPEALAIVRTWQNR